MALTASGVPGFVPRHDSPAKPMIDKTYQPNEVEGRIAAGWEAAGAFRAGRPERAQASPYCIVIPPPNVTGSLHMGHALNNTLQDILVRFERMRGKDVLWQPGTDHAGIATQMVVERQLMERQEPDRRTIGRDKFLEKVWAWKAESGGIIINQLKRLGASCDWSRERFTMDEGLSRAVIKVFVQLYNEGLIYKDKRLVNWDPKLLTAISDLEVQQVEIKGHLWHIRYPLEGRTFDPNDPSTFITVATTRPETMLGDTAVAVHPDDERYKHLLAGKVHAILPLVGRRIPIVGDEISDPEKGTGAVKITPAHDFGDFDVGKRHDLPQVGILDIEARLALRDNEAFLVGVPASAELEATMTLHGADRFKARKAIVERLEAAGLVDKIEANTHVVPHGDRSNVVIEPYLTDQWYVNAKALAVQAITAVREGKTNFVPKNWEKTYFDWMENIQPWCISRQLWWGHQIPAWYGPDGKVFVAETEEEAVSRALAYYQEIGAITGEQARDMARHSEKRTVPDPRRGRARHLVLVRAVAVLHTRLARRHQGAEALLSDHCAGYRLRHHLLLGGPHDDDGAALYERSAVPRRLHPPSRPRREGRQDVEVEGQRRRSARHHRRPGRRCAAHDAGARRGARPRHPALPAVGREQPQLRDQALERRALRRV
jgi:valyl-tRNA synthetase